MSTAPPPPAPAKLDLNRIVGAYVAIRDAKSELTKQYEAKKTELEEQLGRLEGVLLQHLNQSGADSVRTAAGTFYKQVDIKPNIVDDTAFYAWIKEHDAFDALERRVKKTFMSQFMEQHDGGLPPGIQVYRENVVRIRRNS